MPTRYLKPGIRDSERINALSALAECFFYRLVVTVDDFGRFDARPSMLKAACFPIKDDVTTKVCERLLSELRASGLVEVYLVYGKPYLHLQKWDNMPRAKESKYPAPTDGCVQTYADARNPRTLLPVTVTVTGTGTGTDIGNPSAEADRSPPAAFDGENVEAMNGKAVAALSASFALPQEWGEDAERLGWRGKDVVREAEKFRQYWVAGKGAGSRKSVRGWRQAWSNWLSKAERMQA